MLSILIDPDAIGNLQEFDEEVSAMIDYIYDSQPATGVEQVLIPGDPERTTVEQRSAGGIDIDDNSWEDIMNSARDAGLSQSDLDPLLS